jgi:hypothetical protein
MRVIAEAQLRRKWSRKRVGYRVLDSHRRLVLPWTDKDVFASSIPGHFMAVGGVEIPDEGGVIVWGTETEDAAERAVDPLPAQPATLTTKDIEDATGRIISAIPAPQVIPPSRHQEVIDALRGDLLHLRRSGDNQEQILLLRSEILGIREDILGPNWLPKVIGRLSLVESRAVELAPGLAGSLKELRDTLEARTEPMSRIESILGLLDGIRETLSDIEEEMEEMEERDSMREGLETLERAVRKYYAAQGG